TSTDAAARASWSTSATSRASSTSTTPSAPTGRSDATWPPSSAARASRSGGGLASLEVAVNGWAAHLELVRDVLDGPATLAVFPGLVVHLLCHPGLRGRERLLPAALAASGASGLQAVTGALAHQ